MSLSTVVYCKFPHSWDRSSQISDRRYLSIDCPDLEGTHEGSGVNLSLKVALK
ncbi:hypothetical protein [Chamaesiphon sp. VAR_69_metabat_338]|uniref:hypothetical protein n=1 Tax=Chamaesiphon sp. VAR_69_metabat_338 TaxID=2964704 RepID=UPI00286E476F|nr:hypothetical protein [Chamaesiphon sp. VAR_69_metabat_338]